MYWRSTSFMNHLSFEMKKITNWTVMWKNWKFESHYIISNEMEHSTLALALITIKTSNNKIESTDEKNNEELRMFQEIILNSNMKIFAVQRNLIWKFSLYKETLLFDFTTFLQLISSFLNLYDNYREMNYGLQNNP